MIVLLFPGGVLDAQGPLKLSQLNHISWTAREGAPSEIAGLGQTPDGMLWVTTYLGDVQAGCALMAGAHAFLLKATLRTHLLGAIRAVHKGHKRVPAEAASQLAEYAAADSLTAR